MQKVYLLLRSNQQTGPFSLEELLQFDLKPYDLIWIEGRSAGWYYPQEIPALQPYLSFLRETPAASTPAPVQPSQEKPSQPAGPKKVFVSMPSNVSKEEPTPKPSFSPANSYPPATPAFQAATSSFQPEEPEALKTTYAKSLDEVEADYMNWVYQKKKKPKGRVSAKGVLVACLLVGTAFGAWKLLQPADENPGKTPPEQTAFLPTQNELTTDSAKEEEAPSAGKPATDKKQKPVKNAAVATGQINSTPKRRVAVQADGAVAVNQPQPNEPSAPITGEEESSVAEEAKPEPAPAEAPKEKKKLKDKIADLFRKKPEEKKDEARPAEEENGERRSVRREAGSNLVQMVTVKFSVPNDWMMGIKGAKATLTNRSSETIARALVEVLYYNDDGDQLEKRTISFSNIKSKQMQTVSVPDHQTATRLEYNVISATGANEPFARR